MSPRRSTRVTEIERNCWIVEEDAKEEKKITYIEEQAEKRKKDADSEKKAISDERKKKESLGAKIRREVAVDRAERSRKKRKETGGLGLSNPLCTNTGSDNCIVSDS